MTHKILIVDDEPDLELLMLRRFRRSIRSGEHELIFAQNGVEALGKLREDWDISVVLTDINMPQMDGLTLLGELDNLNKQPERAARAAVVKAVVVSAYDDMKNIRVAMNRGALDFLVKPIDFEDVEITIGKTLSYVQEFKESRRAEQYLVAKTVAEANYAQLQELELMRDSLVHMIVHDLRTPLTGVIAGIQSLSYMGDMNELQQELLDITLCSSEKLLDMINDLLTISKMENGSLGVNYSEVETPVLAMHALEQVRALAKEHNHDLQWQFAESLPALRADEQLLCRVLVNLMGNAIKFTPNGGTIALKVQPDTASGALLFSIQDSGPGIPEEHLERIFDKFAQVKGGTGPRTSTGLGLTFCKLAIEAHAGRIWVESQPGQGSTFHFALPVG